jgi:proline iminopeptidase
MHGDNFRRSIAMVLIGGRVLILLLLISALATLLPAGEAWSQTSGYTPGRLRERADAKSFLQPPSQEGVERGIWKVQDGVELFVLEEGKGRPFLFLHGGPGFPLTEMPAGLKELAAQYRVLCPHQRGCGRSTRPFDRFEGGITAENNGKLVDSLGLTQQLADIERIRRILGEERLLIAGHSFGAYLAALYAAEFPERVEKLVLVCPAEVLRMPHPTGGIFELIKQSLPEESVQGFQSFLGQYFYTFGTALTKSEQELALLNGQFGAWFMKALEARKLPAPAADAPEEGHAGGFMPFAVYFSLGMQYDHRSALSQPKFPVLLLHGEKDLATKEGKQDWEQALPNARVEVLPGAGHFPFAERPKEFSRIVRAFLAEK